MNFELQTKRLRLVPCGLNHLTPIHLLWTNKQIKRFLFDDQTISVADARQFIESSERNFAASGWGIWLIYLANNRQEPIGFVGLLDSENVFAPRLLYGLHPDYWEQGFATEAARAVLDHAFDRLGLPKVVSDVDESNIASVRILGKLGMRQTKKAAVNSLPILYFEITSAEYAERERLLKELLKSS